jgi:hypothetical protein
LSGSILLVLGSHGRFGTCSGVELIGGKADGSRRQSIASIPEEEFERQEEDTKKVEREPTSSGALGEAGQLLGQNVLFRPQDGGLVIVTDDSAVK